MSDIYDANGVRFHAEDDMIIRWERREQRAFEPDTLAWMRRVMGLGAFVDVGASTGWYAVLFASLGREVWAFEPNPRPFARLMENSALNGVEINATRAAVSDRPGRVEFRYNARLPLTSGGTLHMPKCGHIAIEVVEAVTLDDALPPELPIGLLKVDVEGHEVPVLRGARRMIERARPPMVLEANTPEHERALADVLDGLGYTYEKADERNMLCVPA